MKKQFLFILLPCIMMILGCQTTETSDEPEGLIGTWNILYETIECNNPENNEENVSGCDAQNCVRFIFEEGGAFKSKTLLNGDTHVDTFTWRSLGNGVLELCNAAGDCNNYDYWITTSIANGEERLTMEYDQSIDEDQCLVTLEFTKEL